MRSGNVLSSARRFAMHRPPPVPQLLLLVRVREPGDPLLGQRLGREESRVIHFTARTACFPCSPFYDHFLHIPPTTPPALCLYARRISAGTLLNTNTLKSIGAGVGESVARPSLLSSSAKKGEDITAHTRVIHPCL